MAKGAQTFISIISGACDFFEQRGQTSKSQANNNIQCHSRISIAIKAARWCKYLQTPTGTFSHSTSCKYDPQIILAHGQFIISAGKKITLEGCCYTFLCMIKGSVALHRRGPASGAQLSKCEWGVAGQAGCQSWNQFETIQNNLHYWFLGTSRILSLLLSQPLVGAV